MIVFWMEVCYIFPMTTMKLCDCWKRANINVLKGFMQNITGAAVSIELCEDCLKKKIFYIPLELKEYIASKLEPGSDSEKLWIASNGKITISRPIE